jgi:hypothetical protein
MKFPTYVILLSSVWQPPPEGGRADQRLEVSRKPRICIRPRLAARPQGEQKMWNSLRILGTWFRNIWNWLTHPPADRSTEADKAPDPCSDSPQKKPSGFFYREIDWANAPRPITPAGVFSPSRNGSLIRLYQPSYKCTLMGVCPRF